MFFWWGEAAWGDCGGEVIYVADSSTVSPRQPPPHVNVVDQVDYFASPHVQLSWDTGWYDDVAFEGLDGIDDAVQKTVEDAPEQFALGGFPNTSDGPEWVQMDEPPYSLTEQETQQKFALLRSRYRVLLLTDSHHRDQSRLNFVIRTQDMADGRFDTVELVAEVGP